MSRAHHIFLVGFGCLLLAISFSQCGYRLEGRGVFLPEHIKKVAVPVLENNSYESDLAILLTTAIIDNLNRRGGVEIVSTEEVADAILSGTVENLDLSVLSTDDTGQATAYRISIRASLTFEDKIEKRTRWKDSLSKIVDYQVEDSAASTDAQERQALEEAAEDFADTIVAVVFLGF